ncbi:MAG: prepilin-type N-terminal cleavage/methylation domain-containing protein [Akkermansiaceae bacterium]|jgi:prepilin-type N-terminal cleavage/methylation domain-containing protein|nr:prepilin-type N-terminal cleavage/methylation domain-containing protein [Akkermansiaceae bacterium]
MTSAARKTSDAARPQGFSLLEMVVVLALVAMVIAGAAGAMYFNRDEGKLNRTMGDIEILAKRARAIASLQQRPYALEFSQAGVALMPYAEALMAPEDRGYFAAMEGQSGTGEQALASAGNSSVRAALELEPDFQLSVRRWATGDWVPMDARNRQVWRFDPQGICEPVGVRLDLETGSWVASMFHPLTAGVADTESEIR